MANVDARTPLPLLMRHSEKKLRASVPHSITINVERTMVDKEIVASQLKADRFPFPSEGDIMLTVRNASFALGPVMVHITMKPGSVIPAHDHESLAEALYVMEGEFINEGKRYQPGTSLHFKAGNVHGPHGTKKGCTILVLWTDSAATQDANLGDFVLAEGARR
jgi:quercetin dioxygenase-like cupin family protein